MAEAEVSSVRAMAGSDLVEAYDEALLAMARRETGDISMTLDDAERWYHGQSVAQGRGSLTSGHDHCSDRCGGSGSRSRSGCRGRPKPRGRSSTPAISRVDDLLADLTERYGHGEPIDVAGSVDVGHCLVDVLGRRAVVVMLTRTPTDIIVLAIGRT